MEVMKKLGRITLGDIIGLNYSKATEIGVGSIRGGYFNREKIILKNSNEKMTFYVDSMWLKDKEKFFDWVDNVVLMNHHRYLSEVEYSPRKFFGLIPHKLKGKFYQEKAK